MVFRRLRFAPLFLFCYFGQAFVFFNTHGKINDPSFQRNSVLYSSSSEYCLDSWYRGYDSCRNEMCVKLNETVPLEMEGTFYRNGPGSYDAGKDKILHPFDADGMITAITFNKGNAFFRNRFVQTDARVKEGKLGRRLFRCAFSNLNGGIFSNIFKVNPKNPSNTNAVYWAGRLLSLSEAGLPYRIEADSLRTFGKYTFKGLLKKGTTLNAHPRIDSNNNHIIHFNFDLFSSTINVYEFDNAENLKNKRYIYI